MTMSVRESVARVGIEQRAHWRWRPSPLERVTRRRPHSRRSVDCAYDSDSDSDCRTVAEAVEAARHSKSMAKMVWHCYSYACAMPIVDA